jgi:hypothetical protein
MKKLRLGLFSRGPRDMAPLALRLGARGMALGFLLLGNTRGFEKNR